MTFGAEQYLLVGLLVASVMVGALLWQNAVACFQPQYRHEYQAQYIGHVLLSLAGYALLWPPVLLVYLFRGKESSAKQDVGEVQPFEDSVLKVAPSKLCRSGPVRLTLAAYELLSVMRAAGPERYWDESGLDRACAAAYPARQRDSSMVTLLELEQWGLVEQIYEYVAAERRVLENAPASRLWYRLGERNG